MSPAIDGAQLFVLAAIAFSCVGSLIGGLVVRGFGSSLANWDPRSRHRALLVLAALPAIVAFMLLCAASLPSLRSLITPSLDHCSAHDDGHAHLCFVHLPKVGLHASVALGIVFLGTYAAVRAALAASTIARALRALQALVKTGERLPSLGVTVLETREPVCLTAGMMRPQILLSRGLLEALEDDERAVVLAHERAHVRRRDPLVASIARALAILHLPSTGRRLVRELEVAAEQACDEEAARIVGSRVSVASAILTVERAVRTGASAPVSRVAVAFGQCGVERRVESMLADPIPARSMRMLIGSVLGGAAGAFLIADELHHVTESLLSVFAN